MWDLGAWETWGCSSKGKVLPLELEGQCSGPSTHLKRPGMEAQTCNFCPGEVRLGRPSVSQSTELHIQRETLPQKVGRKPTADGMTKTSVYTSICIHTCTHTLTCAHTCDHTRTHAYMGTRGHARTHMCSQIHTCTHTCIECMHVHGYTHIHMHMCVHKYTHTHTCALTPQQNFRSGNTC